MELIFILTYNCNYRCRYCDIDKRVEDMSSAVLDQSLIFLKKQNFTIHKVKFFWGEPLLKIDAIQRIVTDWPMGTIPWFYVTTNGSLLSKKTLSILQDQEVITTLSIDWDAWTTNENRIVLGNTEISFYEKILKEIQGNEWFFRVNQVITPKNVSRMEKNYLHLYKLGFRKFNFLPEYYVAWDKDSLRILAQGFGKILSRKTADQIYLVNAENYSPTSFFNFGLVIDADGVIYGTNLILSGRFEKYKPKLRIGTVWDSAFHFPTESEKEQYLTLIEQCIEEEYSGEVLKSVEYVNKILSSFTLAYGK